MSFFWVAMPGVDLCDAGAAPELHELSLQLGNKSWLNQQPLEPISETATKSRAVSAR